jgi:hypothetical protein
VLNVSTLAYGSKHIPTWSESRTGSTANPSQPGCVDPVRRRLAGRIGDDVAVDTYNVAGWSNDPVNLLSYIAVDRPPSLRRISVNRSINDKRHRFPD